MGGKQMQGGFLRRLPFAAGLVVAVFGLSGCHHDGPTRTSSSSPSDPASSPTTEQPAASDGACGGGTTYKGGGDRLQISFVLSQDGKTICNLRGEVEIACASMSAANDSLLPYSDSNTISVDSDDSFSDQYALGSGSLTVNGTVDDEKSAHGTFEFHETSCTSGTIPWQVPYTGSPTSTTQPSASSSCNNPCGSFDGVTVEVTGVDGGTVTSSTSGTTGEAALIVTATVSNDSGSDVEFNPNQLILYPGSSASLVDTLVRAATDSSGHEVQCSAGSVPIAAGDSTTIEACYEEVNAIPAGTALRLQIHQGTPGIDIGQAP